MFEDDPQILALASRISSNPKRLIEAAEAFIKVAIEAAKSMAFCTVLAHKRMADFSDVSDTLKYDVRNWLKDNWNPTKKWDPDDTLHDLIFYVRDRTEEILEVK